MTDSRIREDERNQCAEIIENYAGTPTSDDTEWEHGWRKGLHKAARLIRDINHTTP